MTWETSLRAWQDMQKHLREQQLQVLGIVCEHSLYPKWGGICDNEMHHRACERYGVRAYSTYRSRRCELVHLGVVVPSGQTREPFTGPAGTRPQTVWRVVTNEEYAAALEAAGGFDRFIGGGLGRIAATKGGTKPWPTTAEVMECWQANEQYGPYLAADAVRDLFEAARKGGHNG